MTVRLDQFLYPRLPRASGQSLVLEQAGLGLLDLRAGSSLSHPHAAPSPVGGRVVSRDRLEEVRQSVQGLADDFGFPSPLSASKQAEFDRFCGTVLYRDMGIIPGDAGSKEVWSFLTLVVLPEITPWRFGRSSETRCLGGTRNTLQRLWWRAWSLGPDLTFVTEHGMPLGEDEYVQIMERTTISGNQRTAQAIQRVIWNAELAGTKVARTDFLRDFMKRVRAAKSHILLDSITDHDLDRYLISLGEMSRDHLSKSQGD
jgi:hypothetical protein